MMKRSFEGEDNAPKKITRVDEPSPVVFLRHLPLRCNEQDLRALARPYGEVRHVVCIPPKMANQTYSTAFVEFADIAYAIAFVNATQIQPGTIGGQEFYTSYSAHKALEQKTQNQEMPSPVLMVIVKNALYPVTINDIHTIFSKYGQVHKIVMFKKTELSVLVEMDSIENATKAMQGLDGLNIYANCCTMTIKYSKSQSLNVKINNETSRDFTNPSLPQAPTQQFSQFAQPSVLPSPGSSQQPFLTGANGQGDATLLQQGQQQPTFQQMQYQLQQLQSLGMTTPGVDMMAPPPFLQTQQMGNMVIIVSGFEPTDFNCDKLQKLFGFYGDVQRVKILYTKPDNALIQFSNPTGAQNAVQYLNGFVYHDKTLRVSFSKHLSIALPKEGTTDQELTKDYSSMKIHRYAMSTASYRHICAPTKVIYVVNLADETTEEELRTTFSAFGEIVKLKINPPSEKLSRTAFIEYTNTDSSVAALMGMHNELLGERHVRVSFSHASL